MKTIHYYFAPQSPYAYFGHARLRAMAQRHGAAIEPKPFDLAAIFGESGGVPIAKRAPQRQAYRLAELKRWAGFLGLPLNLHPKFFPVDQTAASLLLVAARNERGAGPALDLAGALMRAVWVEERDIADAATLQAIADDCGVDGAALLDAARTAEVRRQYDGFNGEAIDAGIFGSPWYIVDGQGFWGQDRLDFVERLLHT